MAQVIWQKSSYSASTTGNECMEVAAVNGGTLIRESDAPDVVIASTPEALGALICVVKAKRDLR